MTLAFFTAQYRHGTRSGHYATPHGCQPRHEPFLDQMCQRGFLAIRGYATAHVKWHLGNAQAAEPGKYGFDFVGTSGSQEARRDQRVIRSFEPSRLRYS
jgi:hypothetical protein